MRFPLLQFNYSKKLSGYSFLKPSGSQAFCHASLHGTSRPLFPQNFKAQ